MSNPTELPDLARMSTTDAQVYLVNFMMQHFSDKTYHRYILGQGRENHLAGDFAWQMATALRKIEADRRAQPEGEAPQVEPVTKVACPSCNGIGTWIGQHNGYDDADCHMCDGAGKVAATLSPLCGTQHAESGAPGNIELIGCIAQMADQLRAVSPLNMALERAEAILAAQQAAAPGALDEARELLKTARDDCGLGSELGGKVDDFLERSASAPGTPEAPDWEGFAMAVLVEARDNLGSDVDGGMIQEAATHYGLLVKVVAEESCGENCVRADFDTFPQDCYRYSKGALKAIRNEAQRAAQLDGGQEGSDHA